MQGSVTYPTQRQRDRETEHQTQCPGVEGPLDLLSLYPGEDIVTNSLQSPEELHLSVVPQVLQAQASTPLTTGSDLLTPDLQAALPFILFLWDRLGCVHRMRTNNGTAMRT